MRNTIMANILALAILDVANDIAFLNSILYGNKEEDEDTDKHPLIGKRYIVTDNSYAIDKESGVEVGGLQGKEYIIVSDPYVEDTESIYSEMVNKHLFVDVFSIRSARKYRVLFQEKDIVED